MAPTSYQGTQAANQDDKRTYSQSAESNLSAGDGVATVATVLEEKGNIVYSISPDASITEAVSELRSRGIGAMLVLEADKLVGILSERDVVRQLDERGAEVLGAKVSDLMTADPYTCTESMPLLSVLRRMTDGHFRHMPVMKDDELVGLISIGDVVKARLRQLEYEALRMKQMIVG